ncbi:MAG: hypothetical protein LBB58_03515 [Cellulomonadaceae bacterium]|jgi:hypothetical protein|nr:hypothetical protein [Cellulomonadaceae bacterium]
MTNDLKITTRPIHFTVNVTGTVQAVEALGLTRIVGAAGEPWQEFAAPKGGVVAIHEVGASDPLNGTSKLGFVVPDMETLKAVAAALCDGSDGDACDGGYEHDGDDEADGDRIRAQAVDTDHGTALQVTAPDGLTFLVDITDYAAPAAAQAAAANATKPARTDATTPARADATTTATGNRQAVEVAQIWFTKNTAAAQKLLKALGAAELVTAIDGGWDDTRMAGGGRTQIHGAKAAMPWVSAGFMLDGDLTLLRDQVIKNGLANAAVVDENWGQYLDLGIADAKGHTGLDGELTWVNRELTDFYGYRQL